MIKPVVLSGECNITHTLSSCGEFLVTIRGKVDNIKDYDLKKEIEAVGSFSAVLSVLELLRQAPFLEYQNFVFSRPDIYFHLLKN